MPGAEPKKKPIDRWFAVGSVAVGIGYFLLTKTPAVIIVSLLLIFLLLLHPVWNFWWIEEKLWRRLTACFFLVACLSWLGYVSWPHSPLYATRYQDNIAALLPTTSPSTTLDDSKKKMHTTNTPIMASTKKTVAPKIKISGDNNVTSINQSGGITAGTYINQADPPRRLKPNQIAELQIAARNACPMIQRVTITAANSNQEAQVYALDFVNIFKTSGCISDLALPIPSLTADVVGIRIGVRDIQNIPPSAIELGKILSRGGIPFKINPLNPNFFPDESIILVVGAKQ